ncbi:MAG: 6-phosphofructokinase [Thermoplasmata archaeon HGW-Thermoplasmata-1]|nr:MAG: 6-phosphofructokinase [Thermoplasmata archaeon HGW-Thermoplasmata-1]
MKVGLLTGGGDCPGLNAVICAVVKRCGEHGYAVLGIRNGWAGLLGNSDVEPLGDKSISGILAKGGTILGTSRTNPFKHDGGVGELLANLEKHGIDAIIAIGGNDTLGVAQRLHEMGIKIIGVPKTIDNDLCGTDVTFGFDTAVSTATEAIDRLHSTAEAHNRVLVVEVMGRHAGWIATEAGLAGGAHCIIIPEQPYNIEDICNVIKKRRENGKTFSIVVVAEGAGNPTQIKHLPDIDQFGNVRLGGISYTICEEIRKHTGFDTRVVVLGHIQRGGTPTARDRVLATLFGIAAADFVKDGRFGKMTALCGNHIKEVDIKTAIEKTRLVDPELYDAAKLFFG